MCSPKSFSLLSYPFGAAITFSTFLRFIEYTCLAFAIVEVLFYTLKERRRVYVVETVYIIYLNPHPNSRHEQIMQIFHPRYPILMYLSSSRQVYSTEKLRSRNRHFSRYFHDSTNRSKVALIFTGDSVLNRTLAE